jgi:hypothetical protein
MGRITRWNHWTESQGIIIMGRIVEQNHPVELKGRIIGQIAEHKSMAELQDGFKAQNCGVELRGRIVE